MGLDLMNTKSKPCCTGGLQLSLRPLLPQLSMLSLGYLMACNALLPLLPQLSNLTI